MLEKRLNQVLTLFGVLNLLVVAHLVRLQVVPGERNRWMVKGEENRSRREFIMPLRGPILLKDGRVVVKSERQYDLRLNPGKFRDAWPPGALTAVLRKLKRAESFWMLNRGKMSDVEERLEREARVKGDLLRVVLDQPERVVQEILDTPVSVVLKVKECLLDGNLSTQLKSVFGRQVLRRLRKYTEDGGDPLHAVGRALGLDVAVALPELLDRFRAESAAFASVQRAFGKGGAGLERRLWSDVLNAENNARRQLAVRERVQGEAPFDWGQSISRLKRHERSLYRKVTGDHLGRSRFPARAIPYEVVVEIHRARFQKRLAGFSPSEYSGRNVQMDLAPHVVGSTGRPLDSWIRDFEVKPMWHARAVSLLQVEGRQREILSLPGMPGPDARDEFLDLEAAKLEKPHTTDRSVGRSCIELWYDHRLRGRRGIRRYLKQPGRKRPYIIHEAGRVDGGHVVMTLEPHLQQHAQMLLEKDRQSRNGEAQYAGRAGGALVALDPQTGEILVLATDPTYSLKEYRDRKKYMALHARNGKKFDRPLNNRAVEPRMPGSIFKVFTALMGLENGLTQNTTFQCWGRTRSAPKPRCASTAHRGGKARVDLEEALYRSCNAYFARVADFLWNRKMAGVFQQRFQDFHLHESLLWGDRNRYHKGICIEVLRRSELRSQAIGQGPVSISPLQAAVLFSIIARRGLWRPPFVVEQSPHARVQETRVFNANLVSLLIPGMVKVTTTGTARRAFLKFFKAPFIKDQGITVAGKTGTTTFDDESRPTHSWFACFAPADRPGIVVVVFLEHRGLGGGEVAAPMAAEFLKFFFEKGRIKAAPFRRNERPR